MFFDGSPLEHPIASCTATKNASVKQPVAIPFFVLRHSSVGGGCDRFSPACLLPDRCSGCSLPDYPGLTCRTSPALRGRQPERTLCGRPARRPSCGLKYRRRQDLGRDEIAPHW